MKKLLFLLLFPLALQAQKYKVFPSEYDCHVVNPLNGKFYSVLNSSSPLVGAPTIIDGCGCLHHSAFIDASLNVWAIWDNATETLVKTPAINAKQVQAYNNGSGNGIFVVTRDGKLQILGNSQSGFRGDGTAGSANETTPFTVTSLSKPVTKVAAGTYVFALLSDSTVWAWGGGSADDYHAQYAMGVGVSSPNRTKPTQIKLPEPIVDIEGGGDWTYAIGKSGALYGTASDIHFLGITNFTGQLTWYNLGNGKLPGAVKKLSLGPEATYALMPNGDLYAWGNNTQAAIGNGQEGVVGAIGPWGTTPAPWGVQANSLWVMTPYKVNPPGVVFVNVFTNIGDAFYVYAEDSNGNLWVWGRNKGWVLWDGQGSNDPNVQAATPNAWDVLSPLKINAFGPISVTPPPANKPPIAVLTGTVSTTLPADTLLLDGSGSSDPDGLIATYSYLQVSGPPAVLVPSGARATVYATAAGTYMFRLTVVDNAGATNTAFSTITVNPYPTCPPPVVCPPQRSVTAISVTINGVTYPIPLSWLTITY